MILAATAWVLAAAPEPTDVAGLYVSNQMEVAAALELQPGGHFRYQLDYGAVSEGAEGDWKFDGTTVRLTTNPAPKEPAFALVRDDAALAGQLFVAIDSPNFSWSPLNVELTLEGTDEPVLLSTQDEGRVPIPSGRRATAVKLLLPIYATGGDPVKLSPDRGHRLVFKLEPNDMGKAAFQGQELTSDGASFVMHRYDTRITFKRAEP